MGKRVYQIASSMNSHSLGRLFPDLPLESKFSASGASEAPLARRRLRSVKSTVPTSPTSDSSVREIILTARTAFVLGLAEGSPWAMQRRFALPKRPRRLHPHWKLGGGGDGGYGDDDDGGEYEIDRDNWAPEACEVIVVPDRVVIQA